MKQFFAILVLCVTCAFANAQKTISGTITDAGNGEPLIGVSVMVKDTSIGTVTDLDGKFTLQVPTSGTLVISFIGYDDKELEIASLVSPLSVELKEAEVGLNQVVISGSKRTEKILESPAAISVINAAQIKNSIPLNLFKNIEMTPGVDIIPTGLVGGNVVTRGFNNIFSGSLFTAVDNRIGGVPSLRVNAFQLIPTSTEDIERIEVVKGPAATAVWSECGKRRGAHHYQVPAGYEAAIQNESEFRLWH